MADLERLKRALQAAHAAGDTAAATKLAQAIRAAQAGPSVQVNDNPDGTGIGRAIKRGGVTTAAAVPTMLATADLRALNDTTRSPDAIRYDEALRAGLPNQAFTSRAADMSDPKQVSSMMQQYGLPSQLQTNYQQVVEKRLENREDASANPAEYLKRLSANADTAQRLFKLADSFERSPTANAYAQSLAEAPDSFKGWLSTVTDDPIGFMAFMGETIAENVPQIAAGIGTSTITGSPTAGAGVMSLGGFGREYANEVNQFLREKGVDLSKPGAAQALLNNKELMDEANERGVTRGLVIAAADMAGQGLVARDIIKKSLARQAVVQGGTEGAGEAAATKAVGDDFSAKETITEALAGVGSTVGEAAVSKTLFNKDGKLNAPGSLQDTEARAAASLARRIRSISETNGYNLKDVGQNGDAKQALESVHEQISGQIKEIVNNPAVRKFLSPKQARTLDQLIDDYAAAQVAIRQSKNKVKSKVTQENFDAIMRLLPPTAEAQQIANLMLEGNHLTDLFKNGTRGGVSQFTDTFNPFAREDGTYDPSKVISSVANKGLAISTAGASLPFQAGAVIGGRAIDAVTGRRSAINRFVRNFEGKEALPEPTGPSLIAAEQLQREQDEARAAELGELPQVDKDNSPIGRILSGTGLDRDGLRSAMEELQAIYPNTKAIDDVFGDIRRNLDGGNNRIRNLNDIIRVMNSHLNTTDTAVQRVAVPDQLLAQRGGINMPQVDTTAPARPDVQTQAPAQPQYGPQMTTEENYNRGIEANRTAAQTLSLEAQNDANLSVQNKAVIASALDKLQSNLGSDPVMAAEAIMEAAVNAGVPQEAIDAYILPYVQRVMSQQQSRPTSAAPGLQAAQEAGVAPTVDTQAPPRMSMAPQEDLPQGRLGMDFKDVTKRIPELQEGQRKLQANEITREDYEKLVNKYKPVVPYETTPQPETTEDAVYALSNGKGQSEAKAAKFGLPSKELKAGERVQFRLDIPSYSQHGTWVVSIHRPNSRPDSTAEGRFKAGPVVGYESVGRIKNADLGMLQASAQKIASGSAKGTIATMLGEYVPMTPQEAYQYVNEVLPMTLEPNSGYAQVGMDPERHSYFYDRNTMEPIVSAEDLVQIGPLVVAKNPVYAPKLDFRYNIPIQADDGPQPIPRGETTNIQMPNGLGLAFKFAKGSNFNKGRDFKIALQEKALAAQKEEGIDLSELSDENINRLADYVVADALVALEDNSNAIGWYDRTVTDALTTLSEIYPEIQTSTKNKLQFIWALAVTSNGTKVDKNFELAATAYDHLQRTGRFPTNIGIGEAARAINGGLQQYHTMLEKFERKTNSDEGDHQLLADFMNSQVPVKQIEQEYGVKISGEGKNTLVRGASILGPKIGNGFFSNLYGNFDALTMDRWLMRTVGRYRGTLISINEPMIKKKTGEIKTLLKDASPETMKALRQIFKPTGVKIGKNLNTEDIYRLATRIAKESTSQSWREGLNEVSSDLRKAGNALAKYLDGQVEAPAGAKERDFIRAVFQQALKRLNTEPSVTRASNTGLTMSDLQALLWYPEKRLYDSSKAKEGEESRGYADDEAPDYANAARKLAERRQANADGNRLGSPGATGPGGGGASSPNARLARPPVTEGVAGVLASRIAGGPAKRASVPSAQEVKQAAEPVRAIIEVGKKGSKYEDGIKNIDQVRELADAINVSVFMYNDQKRMRMDAGAPDATEALGLYANGNAYSLTPSASRSEFQTYITTLHEVAHGLNDQRYSPGSLRTFSPEQQQQLMGTYAGFRAPMTNNLTGRKEQFRRASFDEYIGEMLAGISGIPKDLQKKVLKEMKDLQDQGKYRSGRDVRYEGGAKLPVSVRKKTEYYKYIRSAPELAVDPVIYYLHDPKGMKKNYPVTAEMIKQFFRNSSKVQFYSHPLAMAFAVALAMLTKAGYEDEQEKQQMPPGALNAPMMPGALSA